jgi:hypothetical protein
MLKRLSNGHIVTTAQLGASLTEEARSSILAYPDAIGERALARYRDMLVGRQRGAGRYSPAREKLIAQVGEEYRTVREMLAGASHG